MNSVELLLISNTKPTVKKKHEAFALAYLQEFDIIASYKAHVAKEGEDIDDRSAKIAGSRLLRSEYVQSIIDRETCRVIAEHRLEKDTIIARLQRTYFLAIRDGDYGAANNANNMLMKHFGMYAENNKQKRYSSEDILAIRQKLEANGLSFEEPNMPKDLESIEDVEVVIPPKTS